MNTHEGRVAVVTGAAQGIGRAIAQELAARGADIIAVDIEPADETVMSVQAAGRTALSLPADISDPAQVADITDDMLGFAGRVDILVNDAAIFSAKDVFELDFAEWRRVQGVNIDSQYALLA